MRKLKRLNELFGIIFFVMLSSLIQAQTNNASLDETISFLKSKIDKVENFDTEYLKKTRTTTLTYDKTNCTLIMKEVGEGSTPYESVEYIPISKIDPSSIIIIELEKMIIVHFDIIGKQNLIKRKVTEKWEGGKINNVTDNFIQWNFDLSSKQNDIPERVKKALLHAINLCGGIDEKF